MKTNNISSFTHLHEMQKKIWQQIFLANPTRTEAEILGIMAKNRGLGFDYIFMGACCGDWRLQADFLPKRNEVVEKKQPTAKKAIHQLTLFS